MTEDINYILFAVLRSVINGSQMSDIEKNLFTYERLPEILNIAKKHDISHLVALGLMSNQLIEKDNSNFQQLTYMAIFRYEKINYELCRVCEVLEKAQIPFVPLKGSVIRKYYPEPWMRTSCDIDILVQKDNFEEAVSHLKEAFDYTFYFQTEHDISLSSQSGVHVELHFDLVEEGRANLSSKILESVWNVVTPRAGFSYWCEMQDEMFYFYHVAHMAKHFENGGCGIRTFIDLWILDNIKGADFNKRNALLEKGKLLRFAEITRKLSTVWFGNEQLDSITEKMQNFIFRGGVYGNSDNNVAVQQWRKGGSMKYALSRIVIPYNEIKLYYPILQKYRWLTPAMQVVRWYKLIFSGHSKRIMRQLSGNQNLSKMHTDDMKQLMTEIGL